jgi:ferric-dicitrate binding protein FerR (iron transport regulator)
MEWVMTDADELSAEYLMRRLEQSWKEQEDAADMTRELNRKRRPDRVSPLEAVAGFAVVALVFVLIFWGIA